MGAAIKYTTWVQIGSNNDVIIPSIRMDKIYFCLEIKRSRKYEDSDFVCEKG